MRIHVDLQSQDFSFPALVQVFGIQFCLGQRGQAPSPIHSPARQGQVRIDIPVLVIGMVLGITIIFGLAILVRKGEQA